MRWTSSITAQHIIKDVSKFESVFCRKPSYIYVTIKSNKIAQNQTRASLPITTKKNKVTEWRNEEILNGKLHFCALHMPGY